MRLCYNVRIMNVIVTAGPTREYIDAVRFISNRSSGRMGFAIAEVAAEQGHNVVLISGPVALQVEHPKIQRIDVETAEQMLEQVLAAFDDCDVLVMCAAVADFKCRLLANKKMKKSEFPAVIELERNPDILEAVALRKEGQFVVGFAAETHDVVLSAQEKCRKKSLDLIVANDVSQDGAGFDSLTNIVSFVYPDGRCENLSCLPKKDVAKELWLRVPVVKKKVV